MTDKTDYSRLAYDGVNVSIKDNLIYLFRDRFNKPVNGISVPLAAIPKTQFDREISALESRIYEDDKINDSELVELQYKYAEMLRLNEDIN